MEAPLEKLTIKVAGKDVILDPKNMQYNEANLAEFMNKEYGWIDYLGKQLEHAQKEALYAEVNYDAVYSEKFKESKDSGASDNYAKAFSLSSQEVIDARKEYIDKKENVGHLRRHLDAWNKNHENAQNRGHTVRAEMKSLNRDYVEDIETYSAQ